MVWRGINEGLEMAVEETPEPGWRRFGPLNGGARHVYGTLARLLWLALNEHRGLADLPLGWADGVLPQRARLAGGPTAGEVLTLLDDFFWESPAPLLNWLATGLSTRTSTFDRKGIEAELETLREFAGRFSRPLRQRQQLALL